MKRKEKKKKKTYIFVTIPEGNYFLKNSIKL